MNYPDTPAGMAAERADQIEDRNGPQQGDACANYYSRALGVSREAIETHRKPEKR